MASIEAELRDPRMNGRAEWWEEFRRGWLPLVTGFIGVATGYASLNAHTQGAFMLPLTRELGWSRGELSMTSLITGLLGLPASLVVGSLVDRYGPRRMASISIFGAAAGFYLMSLTGTSIAYYFFAVGFMVIAGMGTSAITYVSLVNLWFDRARGLAIGVVMAGSGVMAIIAPKVALPYIAQAGWRAGYRLLAVVMLATLPLMLIGAIRPGRAPVEGSESGETNGAGSKIVPGWGMSLSEAQRTGRFWRQGLAFFLIASAITGLYAHLVPMLLDSGLTPERAANVAAMFGFAVVVGRLLAGVLLDRFFAPHLGVAFVLVAASGMGALLLPGEHWMTYTAFAIGLVFGTELDIAGYMCARYFGTRAYGAIYGRQFGMFLAGGILSPILYGFVHDRTQSYTGALLISGALMLGAIPLFLSLGAYAIASGSASGAMPESTTA